ncbi:TadE/TadG family type IV pilus assembly protein [Selenomonas sp. FC4001]|uniref:TadE/TadG family type IV pilus assembly protein n=1 Tax=Selenomonas sp. FC4001 TaxID=1408313 RepID=UPI000565697B|nr:Tad domain-containing protein [Selenomonas sp. FC4001]
MRINRGYSQRGAFLILVAFLLPLIMAMLGFVIDFGNVYWHKSVLQNCADASALGGAKAGDKGKTFKKSDADSMADKLLAKNKRYDSKKKSYQYLGSKSDPKNTHYYVVTLTEKVPMYFLKYFGYKEMEIEASCNVKVHKTGNGSFPLFDNLITFSKELYVVNSDDKIFKGNIIHTEKNVVTKVAGYYEYYANGSRSEMAKEKGLLHTPNGSIWPNDSSYYKPEYAVELDAPQNKALKEYINNIRSTTTPTNGQNITTDNLKNQFTYIPYVSSFDINNDFDKNPNNTHVVVIDSGCVNIHINSDVTCRLIIISLSTDGVHVEGTGKVHMTLYAPNINQWDSLHWNPNGVEFYGTMIAPKVSIEASTRSFTYESPNFPGENGSSNSSMSLADDEDIAW